MPLAICNGAILIVWRAGFTGIEPVRNTGLVVYPARKDLQSDLQVLFLCIQDFYALSTRADGLWPWARICVYMPMYQGLYVSVISNTKNKFFKTDIKPR